MAICRSFLVSWQVWSNVIPTVENQLIIRFFAHIISKTKMYCALPRNPFFVICLFLSSLDGSLLWSRNHIILLFTRFQYVNKNGILGAMPSLCAGQGFIFIFIFIFQLIIIYGWMVICWSLRAIEYWWGAEIQTNGFPFLYFFPAHLWPGGPMREQDFWRSCVNLFFSDYHENRSTWVLN